MSARLKITLPFSRYNLSHIDIAYCLLSCVEIVKCHDSLFALLNLCNGPDKSSNNRKSKAKVGIPIAAILVASALMSGLLSVIGSETALAQQQNMTGTNATAMNATAMNATAMNATAMNATAMNATAMNATMTGTGNATNATGTDAVGILTGGG